MKIVRAPTASALFVLLGTTWFAGVGEGHGRERQEKRDQHQAKDRQRVQRPSREQHPLGRRQQQSSPRQRREKLNQQARQSQPMHRSQELAMSWHQEHGWARQGDWQGQATRKQGREPSCETKHRNWLQGSGNGGYYIRQDRFSLTIGSRHNFRFQRRPSIYTGYSRFSYGGFSFLMVDGWAEYWGDNWYQDDDVHISFDHGHYLNNRRYPRVRMAITVAP